MDNGKMALNMAKEPISIAMVTLMLDGGNSTKSMVKVCTLSPVLG